MILAHLRAIFLALLGVVLAGATATAQTDSRFSLRAGGAAEGWRPSIRAEGLLEDPALREVLASGLPLRFHLRVELWARRPLGFDALVEAEEIALALVQDPLDGQYLLDDRAVQRRFASVDAVQQAVERALRAELRPSRAGRFYYLATLDVETLSLSDLEELRRWLRGEVAPAIGGERSPERVVASGMRRLLVRVLGLPTRSYEARSEVFTVR